MLIMLFLNFKNLSFTDDNSINPVKNLYLFIIFLPNFSGKNSLNVSNNSLKTEIEKINGLIKDSGIYNIKVGDAFKLNY